MPTKAATPFLLEAHFSRNVTREKDQLLCLMALKGTSYKSLWPVHTCSEPDSMDILDIFQSPYHRF